MLLQNLSVLKMSLPKLLYEDVHLAQQYLSCMAAPFAVSPGVPFPDTVGTHNADIVLCDSEKVARMEKCRLVFH